MPRARLASLLLVAASISLVSGALISGCARSRTAQQQGENDAGVVVVSCTEGAHQCDANVWSVCKGGAFVVDTTCTDDQGCTPSIGCTPCSPNMNACDGDHVVACDASGHPTQTLVDDCTPLTCVQHAGAAACAGPCDPTVLAKSYTGCVYYAVDLPQWGLPGPLGLTSIAADQQFAVAVANPWMVAIDVTVERDAAPVGMPAQPQKLLDMQVAPGALAVLPLPQREVDGFNSSSGKRSRSLLTANAYRIATSRPASVYQFNPQNNPNAYSNDASLLIPVNALDESYVALGWPGFGGDVTALGLTVATDNRSFITIVGTQANTHVRVTPQTEVMAGDNVPAIHKGTSYTFTLNEFETMNLDGADFATYGATDFSGTRIEADAPLAVWSGVQCITINPPSMDPDAMTCCCDHLEEQLFPRSSLGADYVVVRSEGRSHGEGDPEFFRILALDDATDVVTSLPAPDDQFTLQAGEVHQVIASDDFTVDATKAIEIGQFQVSQDSSLGMTGDPSFELVPPVAQFRTSYIFLVPSGYMEDWLLVAIPTGMDVMIDGQLETDCDRVQAGTIKASMYDALRCPILPGPHTIASMSPFGLLVEGWGPGPVSYGYTGGMEFAPVNHDCGTNGDCPTAEFCSGGACVPVIQ